MCVQGDAAALERLFLIFLENAVRLKPQDSFAITEIRDSGIGISQDHIPPIFESFYQADPLARARTADAA